MKRSRRRFLHLIAVGAALPTMSRVVWAQSYPARPVRLIVGSAAGSPPDIIARLIGQWLSERLGQPFVVENRPGAGTNIATEAVVRAPADGYTLLQVTSSSAWNATLYDKLNFNFIRDIAPIASIYRQTGVMDVHPSFPAKTVADFITYAKANPGKLNMASTGNGSATHIDDQELDRLLAAVIAEQKRRGVKSGAAAQPSQKQRVEPVGVRLPTGRLNAVRAAFEAGIKPRQIARQFCLSNSNRAERIGIGREEEVMLLSSRRQKDCGNAYRLISISRCPPATGSLLPPRNGRMRFLKACSHG